VALTVLVTVLVIAASSQRVTVFAVQTEVTPEGEVIRTPKLTSVANLRREQAAAGPRVELDHSVHEFGRLDPLTTHEHTFVIRNRGELPLELTEGPTTCKCTLASLPQRVVPPGGKTGVVVRWNTGRDLEYDHSATIYTNDPRRKVIDLEIKGTVAALFRCVPERLVFTRIAPGESATSTAIVYSQVWEDMELEPIVPDLDGLGCTIEEVDPADKQALDARAARQLRITLPSTLPEGYFITSLRLRGRPAGGTEEQAAECELTIDGKMIRRLSVYGPEIDVHGRVDLGRLRQGQSAHVRLLLKLRDEQRSLPVQQIDVTPSFARARIEPYKVDGPGDLGLYYLHIDIPADAPPFRLPPDQYGMLRVSFDHPRVPQLELPLDLTISPREGG
jgi:hypothetical protein